MAIHSSTLAWRIPMDRGAWRAIVYGVAESRTRPSAKHTKHTPLYQLLVITLGSWVFFAENHLLLVPIVA